MKKMLFTVTGIPTRLMDLDGANTNVFRFTIGGVPSHAHPRSGGGAMPNYKALVTADYA